MKKKCAYCKDPFLDFQAKVKVGKGQFHKGCLRILADENLIAPFNTLMAGKYGSNRSS